MRLAHKVWSGIAAGVFTIVAVTDLASTRQTTHSASSERYPTVSTTQVPTTQQPVIDPQSAPDSSGAPGEELLVTRVVDGDTFEVDSGRTVQVLGIDACEAGTYGGEHATESARSQLERQHVALVREPAAETDRHGHDLRYVYLSGGRDFAESAVGLDHTSVYDGHGAPEQYLALLRERDYGEKECGAPPAYEGGGGDVDWPTPGDQGLPDGLLTGGFCATRWWC